MNDEQKVIEEMAANEAVVEALVANGKISPEAMEQAMVNNVNTHFDPEESASMLITLYLPKYLQLVDKLTGRQARRVLKALIEVPLTKTEYKHPTDLEKNTYLIGDRLQLAKFLLFSFAQQKSLQAEQDIKEARLAAETTKQTKA